MKRVVLLLTVVIFGLTSFAQNENWKSRYKDVFEIYNNHCIVRDYKGLFGLVNVDVVEVIAPSFKSMLSQSPNDGVIGVSLDGKKWGYVTINGEVIVPFLYEKVYPFSEGHGVIYNAKQCAMVNVKGEIVVPFIFDIIYPMKDGVAEVVNWCYFDPKAKGKVEFIGGLHGAVDATGKIIVPLQYDEIGDFKNGVATVKKDNLWGLIDNKGKRLLNPVCAEILDFNAAGMAECLIYDRWVYVDMTGKIGEEVPGKNKPKRLRVPVNKDEINSLLEQSMVFVKVENNKNNKCPVLPTNGDYFISKYQVTFGLFEKFLDDTGYITTWERKDNPNSVETCLSNGMNRNFPVCNVSWKDCLEFCFWLGAVTEKMFYMPDEAEWEYAARGGNMSNGYKYAGSNNVDEVAWHSGNANNTIHEVGLKKANELGLYDMSGNAWEWCRTFYDKKVSMAKSLQEDMVAEQRAIRGGGFINDKKYMEVDYREGQKPREPAIIGFRVVYYPN